MKRKVKTAIEKACSKLMSVDAFAADVRQKTGKKVSGTAIRGLIKKIEAGEKTPQEAGFVPHLIADRWAVEPLD